MVGTSFRNENSVEVYDTILSPSWHLVQSAIHPIVRPAQYLELRLRVRRAPRAQWKKKRSKVSGGVEICLSVCDGLKGKKLGVRK